MRKTITLITTPCAGKFTPQARVAVHTRTLIAPVRNCFSVADLSRLNIPRSRSAEGDGND